MTSKERVLTTFARQEPDRVPINFKANPGIDQRVKAHYGLKSDDTSVLYDILGVDFRHVGAPYTGAPLHAEQPDRRVDPLWGWVTGRFRRRTTTTTPVSPAPVGSGSNTRFTSAAPGWHVS
jgi:hypothetical protein